MVPLLAFGMVIYAVANIVMLLFGSSESISNSISSFVFMLFNPLPSLLQFLGVAIPGVTWVWPTVFLTVGALMLFIWKVEH